MLATLLQLLAEVFSCSGGYFKGNLAEMILLCVFLRNKVTSGTL